MTAPSELKKRVEYTHWAYTKNGNELYIAGVDSNLAFTSHELDTVTTMWREGYCVADMIDELNRPGIEIGFLIMDLAEQGKITHRASGWEGL